MSGEQLSSIVSLGGSAGWARKTIGDNCSSAPVKAIELSGVSPDRGRRYRPVVYGNCVFNRKGGEQPTTKEQSVTLVNSIRPNLSGSLLETGEPLIPRIGTVMTAKVCPT